jgi:hypothetical protein
MKRIERPSVEVSKAPPADVTVSAGDVEMLFTKCIGSVREDLVDSPYIAEALRVLPAGGYRSAIGSFWNAVVDDLRNKIIHRSLTLFNKSVSIGREIKSYEDFQNNVTDDQLIEGAYKTGVIGWEASKILKHAKETRHIFDGHPKSSEPSPIKVLGMMEDCIKYVLNEAFPPTIIDLDDYISRLGEKNFDRSEVAVENALGDLPEIYKTELVNRLFTAYIHEGAPTLLRSNIELVLPILWRLLSKEVKIQTVRRVDHVIAQGNAESTKQAFGFVQIVSGGPYLSQSARRYKIEPLVEKLANSLDQWTTEDEVTAELEAYASVIPVELVSTYVGALVRSYVGYTGAVDTIPVLTSTPTARRSQSLRWSRLSTTARPRHLSNLLKATGCFGEDWIDRRS